MADHWNFLANLLGTPGPAEPPPKKEDEKRDPQAEVEASSSTADEDVAPIDAASPVAGVNWGDQPYEEDESDEDVLEALKKVVPEPTVPGFIADAEDSRSTDGSGDEGENDTLDSAWGELASALGVDPEVAPPPRRETAAETPPRRMKAGRPARSPKKTSSGGFGSGLGVDFGPEPEDPQDEQPTAEALELEYEQAPRDEAPRSERPQRGGKRDSQEDRGSREDRPRGRSRGSRDDRTDESAERDRERGADRGAEEERPRRRGRRGVRQRMSEEDVDRVGSDEPRSTSRADADPPRAERKGRSEGAERDEPPPRLSERDEFDVDLDDEVDEFDTGLVSRRDQAAPKDEATSRGRSRRRGRRGRGREPRDDSRGPRDAGRGPRDVGRGPDDGDVQAPEEVYQDRPLPDDLSAFDDDHEDDVEVDVIRRGQRRGRSPSDEGREPDSRGPRRGRERGDADRPESGEGPRRRRRGRGDTEQETPQTRTVPTWIETVDMLVNANIENHKKTPRGGGGGGRGRGGKRR